MSINCDICNSEFSDEQLEILSCGHTYCLICLREYLQKNIRRKIDCPNASCEQVVTDAVIHSLVEDEHWKRFRKMSLSVEDGVSNCLLERCEGVEVINESNSYWECQICGLYNCIICNASHRFLECDKYQSFSEEALKCCETEKCKAEQRLDNRLKQIYRESLLILDTVDLVCNYDVFVCDICDNQIRKQAGVQLRGCSHCFCRICLRSYVLETEDMPLCCLQMKCGTIIQDREALALMGTDKDKERYHSRSLTYSMKHMTRPDRCRNRTCSYMYDLDIEDAKNGNKAIHRWLCPACSVTNCVDCSALHSDMSQTCEEYGQQNPQEAKDRQVYKDRIKNGEMMECPACKQLIVKVSGCNYIKCARCGADLCWITQKFRYGDNGCRCTPAKRCHKDCHGCDPHACSIM